jgi:hypothetical protein
MWLYVLETEQGIAPLLLEDDEPPPDGAPGEWRRVAHLNDHDELRTYLARHAELMLERAPVSA